MMTFQHLAALYPGTPGLHRQIGFVALALGQAGDAIERLKKIAPR